MMASSSVSVSSKSTKKPHKPKSEDTNQEKLYLLHMDLCGPMRVASVNGKKIRLANSHETSDAPLSTSKDGGVERRNRSSIENIIGELARPVSTRLQLHEQALFCYYDAFLTAIEPKTYKDALTQACWIEAMQEELNEFEHDLKVFCSGCEIRGYTDFLAFAAHMNMVVYQMDVKSAFLNGNLQEEVYVSQPVRFVDKEKPQSTCIEAKERSLWVKQANHSGRRQENYIRFLKCPRGILLKHQSKYALESLKKYSFDSCDPVDTPMVEKSKLDEDKEIQLGLIRKSSFKCGIKRIFRYLKGTVHQGLWYSKDSSIALTAFADADHAGCQDTRRSTSGNHLSTKALGRNRIEFRSTSWECRSFTPETLKQLQLNYE
ncbi:retrovirus-related pol polyprotein from transposon TNT 1-94 [Tanacetum coccineum]